MTGDSADPDDRFAQPRESWHHPELLPLLIDSVEDYAIYALDTEGRVVTWNAGAQAVKGYTGDEILGRHVETFYPPADVDEGKPERDLAIATAQGHLADEGWRVRQDGTVFWASVLITALRGADGGLVGFGKVTRDLSERRRGEEMLRDSEERFRLLVSSVADYAIFLLDEAGVVTSWNLGAERLKGYRIDEAIGLHFSVFYTDEDARSGLPHRLLTSALDAGRAEHEGWRVRKDGSRFWASVVITALRSADGSHRGFAKVTQDLTDRKRNEDALRGVLEREREATSRLREVDRMRAQVLELVAHDLRAPLGVVQNLTFLLRDGWAQVSDATRLDYLERISARSTAMADLVEDLYQVVRIDAGLELERHAFDVGSVVDDAIADALIGDEARRIRVKSTGTERVIGDSRRTREVLCNLVGNAAKFSPADSPIDVIVRLDGGEIAVSVVDRGPGIPLEHQHLLFQRFCRLPDSDSAGSGIGLFIAKSLVEAQGGQISVVSAPGAGSTFRFTLPAAP